MNEVEIVWYVDDGYVGGGRPQYVTVGVDDFEGMSVEEIQEEIADIVGEEFNNNIVWECRTGQFAEQIFKALGNE